MAAHSNSTPAPKCMGIRAVTVEQPSLPLADLVHAYRNHNDLDTSGKSLKCAFFGNFLVISTIDGVCSGLSGGLHLWRPEICAMPEDVWGETEHAMCCELAICRPRSLADVIAALELVAEDGGADLFGARHISILHHCSDFLSAQA